jgi:hypothetical protein
MMISTRWSLPSRPGFIHLTNSRSGGLGPMANPTTSPVASISSSGSAGRVGRFNVYEMSRAEWQVNPAPRAQIENLAPCLSLFGLAPQAASRG